MGCSLALSLQAGICYWMTEPEDGWDKPGCPIGSRHGDLRVVGAVGSRSARVKVTAVETIQMRGKTPDGTCHRQDHWRPSLVGWRPSLLVTQQKAIVSQLFLMFLFFCIILDAFASPRLRPNETWERLANHVASCMLAHVGCCRFSRFGRSRGPSFSFYFISNSDGLQPTSHPSWSRVRWRAKG